MPQTRKIVKGKVTIIYEKLYVIYVIKENGMSLNYFKIIIRLGQSHET